MQIIYLSIAVSVFAIIFVLFLIKKINGASQGEGKMIEISQAIREGAVSFLKRQYRSVAIVAVVLFFLLLVLISIEEKSFGAGLKTGIGFLLGASLSALSG